MNSRLHRQAILLTEAMVFTTAFHHIPKLCDDSMAEEIQVMELYFLNKNRIYILSFHSEATGYGNYLPKIQEMVDSFHII